MLDLGIESIYKNDLLAQTHYLKTICEEIRGRDLPILLSIGAFYVPNYQYMISHFGKEIIYPQYDCYLYDGTCKWNGHLVIPVRDMSGRVKGFTGYNPLVSISQGNSVIDGMARYKESSSVLLDKSRFFLCPLGVSKALEDEYIIITDGVFDTLSFADKGFNSMCILGSSLTKEIQFVLAFVKCIYVAYDNDVAGLKLFQRVKRNFPEVYPIVQGKCKDIDAFIKEYPTYFDAKIKEVFNSIKHAIYLKP